MSGLIPRGPSNRDYLPKYQKPDCRYGAYCRKPDCRFIHPTNLDESSRPRSLRDDKRNNQFDVTETCYSDRALRGLDTNVNQLPKPRVTYSTPTDSPIAERSPNHQGTENQHSPTMAYRPASSRDPRRRAPINQKNIDTSAKLLEPDKMSTTAGESERMNLDQPAPGPQKGQMRHRSETQTSYPMSKLADKHADDVGKQTKTREQDDLTKPQQTEPPLPKYINSEMTLKSNSPTTESTLNQEPETDKLPSYKAVSEIITLRFKVSKLEEYKRQNQSNLERYKNSIGKAQSKEEESTFREKYESEKTNLQRNENELAKLNSRARTCLIEFANWIAPIPQHTAAITNHGKEIDAFRQQNNTLHILVSRHDENIQALRVQMSGRATSSEDTFVTKGEHAKVEEKLIDRLAKLETMIDGTESSKPKVQSIHDEAQINRLEMRLRDLERTAQRKDPEISQELSIFKNRIFDLSKELTTLTIHQKETATLVTDNMTKLNALDIRVTDHIDRFPETNRVMESRHADIVKNSAEFAKQLTDRTNGILQTYKNSMDNIQSQINDLAMACANRQTADAGNEILHTSLQMVEASLHKLSVTSDATEKTIREMTSDILNLKHGSGNDIDGRLHQQEAFQLQMQDQMENIRRALHKLAADADAKVESPRHLDQKNGSRKPTESTTATVIDVETAIADPSRPTIGFDVANTGSARVPDVVTRNIFDRRLGVLEMQLVSLRQRFDGFTMDQHIKGIIDVLRQLWPHADIIMRRLGMVEQQSQVLEQSIRDSTDQMHELLVSKAGMDDLEQIRTALDTAVVSITENKQLLNQLLETSAARQGEIDLEKLGPECIAFLRDSPDFSELVKHLVEFQYHSVRDALANIREEFNTLQNALSDFEQRLMQQEIGFESSKLNFEKFKHEFDEALTQQIQMEKARSEKIKKKFKDLNEKIKSSKQLERNSDLQSPNSKLLVTDGSVRGSSSSSIIATPNQPDSPQKPKRMEQRRDPRSPNNRQLTADNSVRSSSSPGLGSCILQTRKKRKLVLEDSS